VNITKTKLIGIFLCLISVSSPLRASGSIFFRAPPSLVPNKDSAPIESSIYLRHLSMALKPSAPKTPLGLIQNPFFELHRPPNPIDLLNAMRDSKQPNHQCLSGKTRLSIVSFNAALLHAEAFGLIPVLSVPYFDERAKLLPAQLLSKGHDILFLQEVWGPYLAKLESAAKDYGYLAFYTKRTHFQNGLMTLVKASLLSDVEKPMVVDDIYEDQHAIEFFFGIDVKRGYLYVRANMKSLGWVHLFNTHFQPFRKQWLRRMKQARHLGLAVAQNTPKDEIAIIGGDLNASPYYPSDLWVNSNQTITTDWLKSTIAYPLLLYYGELIDLVAAGFPGSPPQNDVTESDRLSTLPWKRWPNNLTESPGWCDSIGQAVFTVSDCNVLNALQFGGSEPPARLDHVLARDLFRRIQVLSSQVFLTEKKYVMSDGTRSTLSDHFGVQVLANIDPFPQEPKIEPANQSKMSSIVPSRSFPYNEPICTSRWATP
jgi:endonuclease/exonuclease/phosphatase family metal-dependent hydrolase